MKTKLGVFYAVTSDGEATSLYQVDIRGGEGMPRLTKLALKGNSLTAVGQVVENGTMVCITKQLELFIPEGSGFVSQTSTIQRDIALVNTRYHGGRTSNIVALFLDKKQAEDCFQDGNLKTPLDAHWIDQTTEVLRAIGNEHPYCSISTAGPRRWLMPPEAWQ